MRSTIVIYNNLKVLLALLLISISSIVHSYSPKIIAHRGGGKEFPENTIIAFEEALKSGADSIELDIQLSKDEVIVVYHPRNLLS